MSTVSIDRMLPHSVEAEEAVLGSLLIDPESLHRITPFLRADDFYIIRNRWVYETCLALSERREPIDFVTATEELSRRGQLGEIGGPAFVSHLVNVVPTAIHAEGYARIVERKALRRRLLQMCSDVAQLAYDEATDEDDLLDRTERVFLVAVQRSESRGPRALPEVAKEYYEHIAYHAEHPDELLGVPTGFVDLDRLLGGLQKGDMDIVAGRPSTGKTSIMLNIALNATLKFNLNALFFSLEMPARQLAGRLIAQQSGIDAQRLRHGRLNDDEWPALVQTVGGLPTALWIDDTPGLTPLQLRSKARRLALQHPPDLILIDYLQLMSGGGRHENRNQEMTAISHAIKDLARELDVPVLAASQLSRAVESRQDKRPVLSDLRDSGSLEQDGDVVMFIHREDMHNRNSDRKNVAELIVAKHRNGPTGAVELFFRQELTQFANATRREVAL
jgi:replicative DNA helicase